MILPLGGTTYLGILLSLPELSSGWNRLFEACVPVKTPWDGVCEQKFCLYNIGKYVELVNCDSDLKTGKNLSEPHNISTLVFRDLTSLTEGMFDGFNVYYLGIYFNKVNVFEAGCFDNLVVKNLHLVAMSLDNLPQGFFRGLKVREVQIDGGISINPSDAGIFQGVRWITHLWLFYINKLTYLPKDFFQGLDKLPILRIDSATTLCLPLTIFQPLKSVSEIIISNGTSGLTYCPKMFKGFTNTTTLYAPEVEISTFVLECSSNMNMKMVKLVEDLLEKDCDRNDGCYECLGSALLGLEGGGSAVRGRIVDAAVGVVGALSLVAVLASVGN